MPQITEAPVIQGTSEWLEAREGLITGSIADKLLKYRLGDATLENYKHTRDTFYTKRGRLLEDEAIELYEAIHKCKVARPGLIFNSKYTNAACSPDGIDRPHLIEVKAFAEKNHNEVRDYKSIPFKIMAQLQFNMMICDLKVARLIMYNPDLADPKEAYREIEVIRLPKIQANLKRRLEMK